MNFTDWWKWPWWRISKFKDDMPSTEDTEEYWRGMGELASTYGDAPKWWEEGRARAMRIRWFLDGMDEKMEEWKKYAMNTREAIGSVKQEKESDAG